jgi:hypothetical protein
MTDIPIVERLDAAIQLIADGNFYADYDQSTAALGDLRAAFSVLKECVEALEVAATALDDVWADVKLGQRSGPTVSNARRKVRATLAAMTKGEE